MFCRRLQERRRQACSPAASAAAEPNGRQRPPCRVRRLLTGRHRHEVLAAHSLRIIHLTKEATMMRAHLKRKLIVTLALPAIGLSASAVLAAGDTYDTTMPRSMS